MPNTNHPIEATAEASPGFDRTHFLSGPNTHFNASNSPVMGSRQTETSVMVFDDGLSPNNVIISLKGGDFSLHLALDGAEARTLAKALTMAADHAERAGLNDDIDAAAKAAGVVIA